MNKHTHALNNLIYAFACFLREKKMPHGTWIKLFNAEKGRKKILRKTYNMVYKYIPSLINHIVGLSSVSIHIINSITSKGSLR